MIMGKVIGRVVSTRKEETLTGKKLMVVRRLNREWQELDEEIIATDPIGAGIGEWVLVTTGSSARKVWGSDFVAIDATIVGIIDPNEQD